MAISIVRVAYYSFMLITVIVTFTLHLCAVAGENWVEVEAAGRKSHYGLWVFCEDFNCVRFSNTHLKLPGKFILHTLDKIKNVKLVKVYKIDMQ